MPVPLTLRIEGERVVLRAPRERDAETLAVVQARSRAHLAPWSPLRTDEADELPVLRGRIRAERSEWREDRAYRFVLADKRRDAVIGRVSLGAVVRGVFQNAYLGYWIDVEHGGRGLMSEGVALALRAAFGPLELHRVQAAIIPRNARSLGVARKVGLREEGFARRYLCINGAWEDHTIFALTAEDWAERAGSLP